MGQLQQLVKQVILQTEYDNKPLASNHSFTESK